MRCLNGNLLGGFEGALDLVHGVDAARFFRMKQVDGGRAGAAHLAIGKHGRVHGERLERIGAEPLGQLAHVLAAGVVEVLARGEDLHTLRAGAAGKLQQAGMQALVEEQVGGENAQHRASRGSARPKQAQGSACFHFRMVLKDLRS